MEQTGVVLPHEIWQEIIFEKLKNYSDQEEKWMRNVELFLKSEDPNKNPYTLPELEVCSIFERQREIYQLAFTLMATSKVLSSVMSSNKIWRQIFSLTIGAQNWLAMTPYIYEDIFQSSYKRMCHFLMTFGYRSISQEQKNLFPDPGIEIFDYGAIRNNNMICIKNNELHKYDLKTKELVNLKFRIMTDWQSALSGKYLTTAEDVGEHITVFDIDLGEEIPVSPLAALPEHYTAWHIWFMNEFVITSFRGEIQVVAMDGSKYRHTARGTGAYIHWPKTNLMLKIGSDQISWATIHEREWKDMETYELTKHKNLNAHWCPQQFVDNRIFIGTGEFNPVTLTSISEIGLRPEVNYFTLLGNFRISGGSATDVVVCSTSLNTKRDPTHWKCANSYPSYQQPLIVGDSILYGHPLFIARIEDQ